MLGFELQHGLRIGERSAGHDENVLGALAQRHDLGRVQTDP